MLSAVFDPHLQSIIGVKYAAINAAQRAARDAASGGEVPLYAFLRRLRPETLAAVETLHCRIKRFHGTAIRRDISTYD